MKNTLSILSVFILTAAAQAAPLAKYRAELRTQSASEKAAMERVGRVRKALGTQAQSLAALKNPANALVRIQSAGLAQGRKRSFSTQFKMQLDSAADIIEKEDVYGEQLKFDPSLFISEIEAGKFARYHKICDEKLDRDFAQLQQELGHFFADRQGAATPPTAQHTKLERELAAALTQELPADLQSALGHIYSVDFADGQVTKVRFTHNAQVTIGSSVVPAEDDSLQMSLSMLLTFRSGKEKYFILALHCFDRYLGKLAAAEKATPEAKAFASYVRNEVSPRLAGAIHADEALRKLTRPQVDRLVDTFLQLAGSDVPSEEEMTTPDEPQTWKPGTDGSLVGYFSYLTSPSLATQAKALAARETALAKRDLKKAAEEMAVADGAYARVAEALSDYQYYRLLDTQLSELEDALFAEKERARTLRQIRDDKGVNP